MNKKWKRRLALLTTIVMAAGTLAGCSAKEEQSTQGNQTSQESQTAQEKQTSQEIDGAEPVGGLEEVTLTWYVGGSGPQADTESVEKAIAEYLKDTLNVKLKIVETDWGSYDNKMQLMIASQDPFDMCYTAHWSNNFYNNITKNAFLELNDLLDEYGQDLKELLPEASWDVTKNKGSIYAIPNYQVWSYQTAIGSVTEYLEKYNFDLSSVEKLGDMTPLLEQVKADNPDMYPMGNSQDPILNHYITALGYDELAGRHLPAVVKFDDTDYKVINQFELPEMMEFFMMMREWNEKGYFRRDAATLVDTEADCQAGRTMSEVISTYKPGIDALKSITYGTDFKFQTITEPYLTTSGITATMTAISRTSENPERAMMFLNQLNTDPGLYNLVCFGIEGVHYTREGNYAVPIENSGYNPSMDWMYGNQFNALLREGQAEDDWENTIKVNESAQASVALGFAFDPSPVQTEIASISAVIDEYVLSLATGSVDPGVVLPEMIKKMEAAGSKTLQEEVQRQLDEWVASKK